MRLLLMTIALLAAACSAKEPEGPRIELGKVKWTRDHDAALALSAKTGKPVFALFQEVPG